MQRNEFNFISTNMWNTADVDLFLGPLDKDDGPLVEFDPSEFTSVAHVMHHAGIFKSVGEARRNGWNKPIEQGFSHFRVGKRKLDIFILNDIKESDENL